MLGRSVANVHNQWCTYSCVYNCFYIIFGYA